MRNRILLFITVMLVALIVVIPALAAGPIHRVSVGGPDLCAAFGLPPGCDANFSLVAIEHADGSVSGEYTDQFTDGSGGFHAVIDCLSVSGNEAWVSGVITAGTFGGVDMTGTEVATRVQDNGTSANDPADQISFSSFGTDLNCNDTIDYPLFAVPQGQVRVN